MDAAAFTAYGEPLEIRDVPEPDAAPDGVVVEVEACGICRSDWHAWIGDFDFELEPGHVLGHEPAGHVIEVGEDVTSVAEGDHVAIPFNLGDASCPMCRNGHSNICDNRLALGFVPDAPGAWAEQVPVPVADHNAVRLPAGVSSVEMAGLGCRFMTSFHALAHRARISPGDWVAVHGCGGVGLSAVQIADALGGNVIAVDIQEPKLAKAEDLGAVAVVNAAEIDDVPKAIRDIADGGADVAVDALGIQETCQNAVRSLGKLGQHVQIGLTTREEAGEIPLPTDFMVRNEIEFIGSLGMQPPRYDEIFRMIDAGKLDPGAVVTERVALSETSDVLDAMTEYQTTGIPVITDFTA